MDKKPCGCLGKKDGKYQFYVEIACPKHKQQYANKTQVVVVGGLD